MRFCSERAAAGLGPSGLKLELDWMWRNIYKDMHNMNWTRRVWENSEQSLCLAALTAGWVSAACSWTESRPSRITGSNSMNWNTRNTWFKSQVQQSHTAGVNLNALTKKGIPSMVQLWSVYNYDPIIYILPFTARCDIPVGNMAIYQLFTRFMTVTTKGGREVNEPICQLFASFMTITTKQSKEEER